MDELELVPELVLRCRPRAGLIWVSHMTQYSLKASIEKTLSWSLSSSKSSVGAAATGMTDFLLVARVFFFGSGMGACLRGRLCGMAAVGDVSGDWGDWASFGVGEDGEVEEGEEQGEEEVEVEEDTKNGLALDLVKRGTGVCSSEGL